MGIGPSEEFELILKKETAKAFIFTVPKTGNEVMLPKSTCEVETEEYDLNEGEQYNVFVAKWIAKEKKLHSGGEKKVEIISSRNCKLLDKREKAIRVNIYEEDIDIWMPMSQVKNKDSEIPEENEDFNLMLPEWLLKKKIEEAKEENESNGRRMRKKEEDRHDGTGGKGVSYDESFVDDDIPF